MIGRLVAVVLGRRLKVRLLGIDAPERGQGRIGRESDSALRALMPPGTLVRLEGDVVPTDRWGRRLAYVWAGNVLVNEAMVQGGWALACAPAEWRHHRC